jgi:2-dehydropantoate 2-reductase
VQIGILGAGLIGTYVGAKLVLAGHDVVFVGRLGAEIAAHGIALSDHAGGAATLAPERIVYRAEPEALADREAILVTVKSMATEEAARPLAAILKRRTTLVSLQNGVSNAPRLRALLPNHDVLAGMVPFNVARFDRERPGRFHNGTDGPLTIEARGGAERPIGAALREAGFDVATRADLESVQWSKLILNLNNAVNALAGIPLRAMLAERGYRRVMAACAREGLAVTRAAGIRLARIGKVIPAVAPFVFALPNALFFAAAGAMIKIDPQAKSSMLDDLERRRVTEIDYLNGEIVGRGETHGVATPVNGAIVSLVKEAEARRAGSPRLSPVALWESVNRGVR